ncbi:MAG TPA: hypothetical protein EYQ66_08400 [Myxococcales bacterium]|nr:hypothetical protein [Myxococcales bacterium]
MRQGFLGLSGVLFLGAGLMACGLASGPRDSLEMRRPGLSTTPSSTTPSSITSSSTTPSSLWDVPAADSPAGSAKGGAKPGAEFNGPVAVAMGEISLPVAGENSYCQAKFGQHAVAFEGCQRYAQESFRKLEPVFQRASADSMAMESKRLEGCTRRHDGSLGVDWVLVEHCFSRGVR